MSRRTRLLITLGLILGLIGLFFVWRVTREGDLIDSSPLASPPVGPTPFSSPLPSPTTTAVTSPLPLPPTGTPPVNQATLEAIRATRPTATPLAPSGSRWPYISPKTWRRWALWALGSAGLLAYIGLRLRRNQ